jgi:holo-[acyl-carrier protein] synthase
MLHSIGVDIVDIDRFEKVVERWGDHFLEKILTEKELAYCKTKSTAIQSMAGRFAAKEAIIKCLADENLAYFNWHEVEILNRRDGKPYCKLWGRLEGLLNKKSVLISISHTKTSAVAIAAIQQMPEE